MSGAPTNQTTTTSTEPSKEAAPYLSQEYGVINNALQNGQPAYYPGSTVIDQSDATKNAQQSIINTANDGSQLINNGNKAVDDVTSGSVFSPTAQNTLTAGSSYTNPGATASQSLATMLSGQTNPGVSDLQATANGAYLNSNPYLQQAISNANQPLIDQFNTQIAPGIDSQFAAGGRSGSGAYASIRNNADTTLANALATQTGNLMNQNYSQERQNQVNAAGQIGDLTNQSNQNAINAQGQATSAAQAQQDSRNSAASALSNAQNQQAQTQLQGAGMTADQRNNDYLDANQLAQVGAAQDQYADLQKQADIDKWNYNQNQAINSASQFINVLNGGNYNTQTTTKPVYSSPFSQILGGATAGVGLLSALPGLAALCDVRAKKDIKFVGHMINGTRLYEFRYKSDPSGQMYLGPMAQEVEITKPEAVREIDGFKRVDMRALVGEPQYV